jgi:hypothetical protein
MLLDFISNVLSTISANTLFTVISIAAVIFAALALFLDYRNDRRARDTFSIERRRLTEVNVKIDHKVRLTSALPAKLSANAGPPGAFLIFRLPMENIGDGPVDILGMLASSRLLTYDEWLRGIGARSRDVEWGDYHCSYWNEENISEKIFAGTSTTKHLINTANNFTRLAARELGAMRRIDAVYNVQMLRQVGTINVMYRLFMVARGYSLGEILRQLGGGPPDPALNVAQELLQFQLLAQPNYRRWNIVQQALINLNRFAFRLAIFDPAHPLESADPLGVIAEPDAWRIFLLHHWEFVDDMDDASPPDLPHELVVTHKLPRGKMEVADKIALKYFPARRLPDIWDATVKENIEQARKECAAELKEFVAAWRRLNKVIEQCKNDTIQKKVSKKGCPNEAYPRLIHANAEYTERWLALMKEGYLISKPFYRHRIRFWHIRAGGRRRKLDRHDIPADPRVLEPYVMRTYYFLDSLQARELDDPRLAIDEDSVPIS